MSQPNSSSSVKRELKELRTLYSIRPHFRDILVEGRDDAAWIRWYLSEKQVPHVRVYAVDDRVLISSETVTKYHPEVNARGRVVAAAHVFESWGLTQPSLTAIADADFDVFDRPEKVPSLLKTDYAAMEVYALEARPLSKFLAVSAKSDISAKDLTSLLKPAWASLYALRYVLHRHQDGAKLTDKFAQKCISKPKQVLVDVRKLLLATNPQPSRTVLEELLKLHLNYLNKLPPDAMQGIRGHDIAPLLVRYLGLKNDLADPGHIERLMRQAVESVDLDAQPLFQKLRVRISSS